MSSSNSEHDNNKNIAYVGDWTKTEGARILEQFLSVRGLIYVPSNPDSIPETVDWLFGNELFKLFVGQSICTTNKIPVNIRPPQNQ